VRHTETSDLAAVLTVGGNVVFGSQADSRYVDYGAAIDGTWRETSATTAAGASIGRTRSLQSQVTPAGVTFALLTTDSAAARGRYTRSLTERWSAEANGRIYANRYDAVSGANPTQDNHGFSLGARAVYQQSETTRVAYGLVASRSISAGQRSDTFAATIEFVRQHTPQLRTTAMLGGFDSLAPASFCSAGGCDDTDSSARVRHGGWLYGTSVVYLPSARASVAAGAASDLAPSSTGPLLRSDTAYLSAGYEVTERMSARAGLRASWQRTLDHSSRSDYYGGELGLSYRIAERWSLDAGYAYAHARYGNAQGSPSDNRVFVSVTYNGEGLSLLPTAPWTSGAVLGSGVGVPPSAGAPAAPGEPGLPLQPPGFPSPGPASPGSPIPGQAPPEQPARGQPAGAP
jgi:outer membrane protein assembly factor BamA